MDLAVATAVKLGDSNELAVPTDSHWDEVITCHAESRFIDGSLVSGNHWAVVWASDVLLTAVASPRQFVTTAIKDAVCPTRDPFSTILVLIHSLLEPQVPIL